MSIPSSKGLEFPVVFVFASDALSTTTSNGTAEPAQVGRAKSTYVAFTRAQDLLYLTYSKSTPLLEKAFRMRGICEFHTYPDDMDIRDI